MFTFSLMSRLFASAVLFFFFVMLSVLSNAYSHTDEITLRDAVALTLERNPELKVFEFKQSALQGVRKTASLRPAKELGFDAENFAGSFDDDEGNLAEYTLSISSAIELGGKREARLAVVDAQSGFVESRQKALTLDVLGELTRQFVRVINLQEKTRVANDMLSLSESIYAIANKRSLAGAAPEADALRAKALLAKSKIELLSMQTQIHSELAQLAVFWSGDSPPQRLSGDLFLFNEAPSFEDLYLSLLSNPAVEVFASESRIETAKIQLLKSQSSINLNWELGLRRFEGNSDTALVASLSVPLGSAGRNKGELASAFASQKEVQAKKDQALRELRAQLQGAWIQRENAIKALALYEEQLLPALNEALKQTQQSFESGRNSYMEWVSVQTELFNAQLNRIDLAMQAQLATATIEQLLAQPLQMIETGYLQ